MLTSGEFVDAVGAPVPADAPFVPHSAVWAHRDLPAEVAHPEEPVVLHHDERIVVVDKPHDMATMPRGRHVVQSALARTRVLTGEHRLAPAHRLDRPTAGVLMFTTEQRWRGAYQRVFADGLAHKEYLAVAPVREGLDLPTRPPHAPRQGARHPSGPRGRGREPNAETLVELLETVGARCVGGGPRALPPDAEDGAHPPAALPARGPRDPDHRRPPLPGGARRPARRLQRAAAAAGGGPRLRRPGRRDAAPFRHTAPSRRVAGTLARPRARFTRPLDGSRTLNRTSSERGPGTASPSRGN